MFGIPNPKQHHPEIDTGIHTLFALKQASLLSYNPMVRFGVLLHDLGKAHTPQEEWPSHIQHEQRGLDVIDALCKRLRIPTEIRDFCRLVCLVHLKIHRINELKPKMIVEVLEKTDAFRRTERFNDLLF